MSKKGSGKGFTLIELLVVVAIIALLISILLPSLRRAKDQAKKAVCLAHLKDIGNGVHQYAQEDERNMIMPISPIMVRADQRWFRRCVMWYSWGGRGATDRFMTSDSGGRWINERNNTPYYGTRQRPLTLYMYPDVEAGVYNESTDTYIPSETPVFECPADSGYPEGLEEDAMPDAPVYNAGRRMFDTVGNSYRGSLYHRSTPRGPEAISFGIWGKRLDSLENTSNILWGGDPLFYGFIGSEVAADWPEVRRYGWHTEFMTSNELYADGSARPTLAVSKADTSWDVGDPTSWGIPSGNAILIERGPSYQLDVFPTPATTFGGPQHQSLWGSINKSGWPYVGHNQTPPPIGGWE